MTTSIPHALLARLDPLQGLGEEALAQIGRKARRLPLNTRQKLASSDVHRWLVYLVEGAGELNCGGQGSRLDTVSTRALSPLFTAGDTHGYLIASEPCQLLYIEREMVEVLRQESQTTSYDIIDVRVSSAQGQLFHELYAAYQERRLRVPSMPEVALRIREMASDEDVDIGKLTRIIEADAAVAVGIIRAANSPAYHGTRKIGDVKHAIVRIGLNATRTLASTLAMKDVFAAKSDRIGARMHALWESSVSISALSHVLARLTHRLDPERALLAGLLCRIGAVPVLNYINEHALMHEDAEIDEAVTNLEVMAGALVLAEWELDDDIAATIEESADWMREHAGAPDLCDAVLLARRLCLAMNGSDAGLPPVESMPAYCHIHRLSGLDDLNDHVRQAALQDIAEIRALLTG